MVRRGRGGDRAPRGVKVSHYNVAFGARQTPFVFYLQS